MSFEPKFRVYDEKSDEVFVAEATAAQGDGRYISLGSREVLYREGGGDIIPAYGPVEEKGLTFSWFTGWTDRNFTEVYEGDVVERVRDTVAEDERRRLQDDNVHPNPEDLTDIEGWINSKRGALGVVVWESGGFFIERISGHKRAFYDHSGSPTFSWDEEVEVVGNKWQDSNLLS